jgi:hypothetical protein
MPGEVVTKPSDKFLFDELRRANLKTPPRREADLVPYSYAASHPEFKVRRPSRRLLRRRLIRGA